MNKHINDFSTQSVARVTRIGLFVFLGIFLGSMTPTYADNHRYGASNEKPQQWKQQSKKEHKHPQKHTKHKKMVTQHYPRAPKVIHRHFHQNHSSHRNHKAHGSRELSKNRELSQYRNERRIWDGYRGHRLPPQRHYREDPRTRKQSPKQRYYSDRRGHHFPGYGFIQHGHKHNHRCPDWHLEPFVLGLALSLIINQ